jgi:hypothetical protein
MMSKSCISVELSASGIPGAPRVALCARGVVDRPRWPLCIH